jgi:hypothetical protein
MKKKFVTLLWLIKHGLKYLYNIALKYMPLRAKDRVYRLIRMLPRLFLWLHGSPDSGVVQRFSGTRRGRGLDDDVHLASCNSVLVIHALDESMRKTTIDFASSFAKYMGSENVTYVNVLGPYNYPELESDFDVLILTYELLAFRNGPYWSTIKRRVLDVSKRCSVRIMFPQDDYSFSSRLDDLAVEGGFHLIFSPITKDLAVLYPKATAEGVSFVEALTGYFEHNQLDLFEAFSKPWSERNRDIAQRVNKLSGKYGHLGTRKSEIVEVFSEMALSVFPGMHVDVSFDPAAVLLDSDWYGFLGDTKFTVSRKGGASVNDEQNLLADAIRFGELDEAKIDQSFLEEHSERFKLSFGEFAAVSPRLFEAAAAGVCQILEEDDYLQGALMPWKHYIPLKSDFSNVPEILDFMMQTERVLEVIAQCKQALISNGDFTYKNFIEKVLKRIEGVDHLHSADRTGFIDLDYKYLDESSTETKFRFQMQQLAIQRLTSIKYAFGKDCYPNQYEEMWLLRPRKGLLLPETFTHPWFAISKHLFGSI